MMLSGGCGQIYSSSGAASRGLRWKGWQVYYDNGRRLYSPSDLNSFLDGEFASWMTRFSMDCRNAQREPKLSLRSLGTPGHLIAEPDEITEEDQSIQKHGQAHEAAWLEKLRSRYSEIEVIDSKSRTGAEQLTLAAMQSGAEIIYQAYLRHDAFAGYTDFLHRVPGSSRFGDWHYEVADTKLARSSKAYFLLQLCCYSDLLEQIQGVRPKGIRVVLGTGEEQYFPTDCFFHYYRTLRRSFERFQAEFDPKRVPHPFNSHDYGRWSGVAEQILERLDHLSLVARATRHQVRKLTDAGITSRTALATYKGSKPVAMDDAVFDRLRTQAKLQLEAKPGQPPPFTAVPPPVETPRRGLAVLPPPSALDVFFDIEGYPHAKGGLEYLLGVTTVESGKYVFTDWWAHDHAEERRAFEEFVDWAFSRWKRDPSMHIYHYAAYETTALKRLAQTFATREHEIDVFLRSHVFVDIYTVVRQGLIIGTPSYSLKDIERLYRAERSGDVRTAGGSVVAYEKWLDSGQPKDWRQSEILREIREYNRDDCESLAQCCQWLWQQQVESDVAYLPPPPSDSGTDEKPKHASSVLAEQLLAALNPDPDVWTPEEKLAGLRAHLLQFHWRESKPVFWRMFNWAGMTDEELAEEFECLSGLVRTSHAPKTVGSRVWQEYAFDPDQATKLGEGSRCLLASDTQMRTTIEAFDPVAGRLWLSTSVKKPLPDRLSLMPDEYVRPDPIPAAILRYVEATTRGVQISRAVDDLLTRYPPRIKSHRRGQSVIEASTDLTDAVTQSVINLDRSTLCIQGPPGTGKTHASAHAIVELVRLGRCVGVMANSHKAILNLLRKVDEVMSEKGVSAPIVKIGGDGDDQLLVGTRIECEGPGNVIGRYTGTPGVIGATAWAFSREEIEQQFDYLFVDEAGQVSLANLVAAGLSAQNLVLVGDQMQLSQPIQGAHPGESGQSGIDYVLQGKATIPPELGVFLDTSYRLHPAICSFVSDAVYEGRLKSHPKTRKHSVDTTGSKLLAKRSGILYLPVEHELNSQSCEEEIELIEQLVRDLIGRPAVGKGGRKIVLSPEHLLIVAPFNLQVRELKLKLGDKFRIGSVDKFQGQEAPVVIVSMCSSSLDDCPRGADFLLSPNRLNVAASRAQCLAIVVGSPKLALARCRTVDQMKLVNLFCWLMHHASS